MRFLLILVVIGLVIADGLLTNAMEERAADDLASAVEERSGQRPQRVGVDVNGWPASFRLVVGPAPDATVSASRIPITAEEGQLTRLRVRLSGVKANLGVEVEGITDRSADLPFSARSGRFTAVVNESDFNELFDSPPIVERLAIEDGEVRAVLVDGAEARLAALPPVVRAQVGPQDVALAPDEVPLDVGLDEGAGEGGADVLVLTPRATGALSPQVTAALETLTLRLPLDALPAGIDVEEATVEGNRVIFRGPVDLAAV